MKKNQDLLSLFIKDMSIKYPQFGTRYSFFDLIQEKLINIFYSIAQNFMKAKNKIKEEIKKYISTLINNSIIYC